MALVEQPIYKLRCSVCGEKDPVYTLWPFYGYGFGDSTPCE